MFWVNFLTHELLLCGAALAALLFVVHCEMWYHAGRPCPGEAAACGTALTAVVLLILAATSADASTLTMVTTPVKNIVATVQEIAWYIAPLLLLGVLFHVHHSGGLSVATLVEVVGVVLVIAVAVYAQDILTFIKPETAAASALGAETPLVLWQAFGTQGLTLAALTAGIRYVRRARRL
jgi:hypothetical protein